MKNILSFLLILLSLGAFSQSSSDKIKNLFKEIHDFENSLSPQDSLFSGFHYKGPFSKTTPKSLADLEEKYREYVVKLKQIADKELSRQESISKQIMLLRLENEVSQLHYKMYMIPMNAEGGFYSGINWALRTLPFNTIENYADYFAWLPNYVVDFEEQVEMMNTGIKAGIVAPKEVIQNNMKLLEPWISDDLSENPFYTPLANIPEDWDKKDAERIRKEGQKIIETQVVAAYKKLHTFLSTTYLNAANENPGIKFVTNGAEYYEDRVRHFTTLPLTPDSVHNLGLQEVARIKKLMVGIIEETKFDGSFDDFFTFLRTDEQFYPKTAQELLNQAAWLSKKAEGQLPKLFKKLYSLPFTVVPVADDIAPTYTAGRYSGGSMKRQRAGEYWVNTYKLESRTLYTLPALTLHEAVPGHHLQGSLAQEITDIPAFRNRYYISAFGEGWGLYSEFLGEEMGMYETPYEQFGRYTYEMWRACRLVVDTGIHYKGWSREKAFDYMKSNTALSLHEVNTEIDRYIGWPGQAVSYKIGELKIKALRKQAQEQLGDKFDVREFHYHILKNGSVTLTILEEEIEAYITNTLENDAKK